MKRTFPPASTVSLLLSGLCFVVAVLSHVVPFGMRSTGRWGSGGYDEVSACLVSHGSVHFAYTGHYGYAERSWSGGLTIAHADSLHLHPTKLGFAFVSRSRASHFQSQFSFPLWLPALLFAILPVHRYLTHIRRIRTRTQSCISCGYNLTGNTSGTCPECGTTIQFTGSV